MISERFRDKTCRFGCWGVELENWMKDIQEMIRNIQAVPYISRVVAPDNSSSTSHGSECLCRYLFSLRKLPLLDIAGGSKGKNKGQPHYGVRNGALVAFNTTTSCERRLPESPASGAYSSAPRYPAELRSLAHSGAVRAIC
jgi:hypothetical protein